MTETNSKPNGTKFYQKFLRPLLFKLDPEAAHDLIYVLAPALEPLASQLERILHFDHPLLATDFDNQHFKNPVGLAAGFDKNAKLGLLLDSLGLGFAEIGSVTNRESGGNPKPRLFRLPDDRSVINRLGLNGDGAAVVARRVAGLKCHTPLALNIAKTNDPSITGDLAVADMVGSFLAVRELSLSYVTINASCPNTHDGITRETGELALTLSEIQANNARHIPLFIKLSPDASNSLLESILDVGRANGISGYVCGNTTVSRQGLRSSQTALAKIGNGGLSGEPLKALALSLCSRVRTMKEVNQRIIACGGIASGEDVFQFLQLGASAVQLYTALIYQGPGLIAAIKQELVDILQKNGTSVADVLRAAQIQPIGL